MLLSDPVKKLPLVGPYYQTKLKNLGIETIEDLLLHIPHRYLDFRRSKKIKEIKVSDIVTIKAKLKSIKNMYTKGGKKIQIARFEDETAALSVVWFNQPFLVKNLKIADEIALAGKIDWFGREKVLISPEYEVLKKGTPNIHTGGLIPIYPETRGISSRWLRRRIKDAFSEIGDIKEFLPSATLKNLEFVPYSQALKYVHYPKNYEEAKSGKMRLAFNELFFLQLLSLKRRLDWQNKKVGRLLQVKNKEIEEFIKTFKFELTACQKAAIEEILKDLSKKTPMNRLLEGDVGAGKTVVAAVAAFVSFANGWQSVFMAPTQILAKQHYQTLVKLFAPYKARISLITSESKKTEIGRTDIYVGTHALIHKKVSFDKVALVVIDEQHRFGVKQRSFLIRKASEKKTAPHTLTMTATPIPRTVALTVYGDLDLSVLDELPPGRKPVTTWLVPPQKRDAAYKWIEQKITNDKVQAFIVCPLIEESFVESMQQVRAATSEYQKLKSVFKKQKLGLLHGRLKEKEKDKVINDFKKAKTDILVSTPVIEVGIDISNANIILIEGAERFGLAQLHQLRGRVGRGDRKAYCLLFTESKGAKVRQRLSFLQKKNSGFELAELDLKLRGPGEIYGIKQHGFPELKIASWQDIDLIKKAKKIAQEVIENPKNYAYFLKKINKAVSPN